MSHNIFKYENGMEISQSFMLAYGDQKIIEQSSKPIVFTFPFVQTNWIYSEIKSWNSQNDKIIQTKVNDSK